MFSCLKQVSCFPMQMCCEQWSIHCVRTKVKSNERVSKARTWHQHIFTSVIPTRSGFWTIGTLSNGQTRIQMLLSRCYCCNWGFMFSCLKQVSCFPRHGFHVFLSQAGFMFSHAWMRFGPTPRAGPSSVRRPWCCHRRNIHNHADLSWSFSNDHSVKDFTATHHVWQETSKQEIRHVIKRSWLGFMFSFQWRFHVFPIPQSPDAHDWIGETEHHKWAVSVKSEMIMV